MKQPRFKVYRECQHGRSHAHSVGSFTTGAERWCVGGDFQTFPLDELRSRIAATLANETPRMPIADVDTKADQIVDRLLVGMREAALS